MPSTASRINDCNVVQLNIWGASDEISGKMMYVKEHVISGTQPQVFLAMQTPGMGNQDSQQPPYITLQPVNVDGSDLSNNTLVLPPMDTSILWNNNEYLFQFPISGVEPPLREIMKVSH